MANDKVTPTWGYRGAEAQLFDLKAGEKLPEGWSDKPAKGYHPHDVERGIAPGVEEKAPAKGKRGS